MTGKFHTSWGDFHSFKNQAALEYECFRMLALGAKCSVGDQLPPSGAIETHVYDLIGAVYGSVAQKEPWCRGVRPLVDIGVLSPEEFGGPDSPRMPQATMGVERMLDEGAQQFDIIDSQADFAAYWLLVLPDSIPVSAELAARLEAYLAGGGALIASFESGLAPEKEGFALGLLGVELAGEGRATRRASWCAGGTSPAATTPSICGRARRSARGCGPPSTPCICAGWRCAPPLAPRCWPRRWPRSSTAAICTSRRTARRPRRARVRRPGDRAQRPGDLLRAADL